MTLAAPGAFADADELDDFADLRPVGLDDHVTYYEGRQVSTNRQVALKVLHTPTPQAVDAIERESRVLARLAAHPNIVTMLERVELADGRPVLVLERTVGTLYTAANAGRLDLQAMVAVATKIAGALETVHAEGLLHCAVSPRAIRFTEFGEPVLADFGSATPSAPGRRGTEVLHEATVHTAPELLLGERPSPATDVYGLASALYEVLAGRPAFRSYAGESPAALSMRILCDPVHVIGGEVPLELSDLLIWAMSSEPGSRPPSPAWLAEEFGRIEQKMGWPRTRMIVGGVRGRRSRRG